MRKNELLCKEDVFVRVLDLKDDQALIVRSDSKGGYR